MTCSTFSIMFEYFRYNRPRTTQKELYSYTAHQCINLIGAVLWITSFCWKLKKTKSCYENLGGRKTINLCQHFNDRLHFTRTQYPSGPNIFLLVISYLTSFRNVQHRGLKKNFLYNRLPKIFKICWPLHKFHTKRY